MTEFDVTSLIAETNKHLKPNQQIHPDDPIVVNMIVNQQILEKQIATTNRKLGDMLSESFDRLIASIEQQVQRAEASSERMITHGGSNVEKQLDAAAQRWEERLRKAGTESEASMRRASRLAWIGAALITIGACVMIGSTLGNLVFSLIHRDGHKEIHPTHPAIVFHGRKKENIRTP
jgi:transcriptional regulator of heat shock response